MANLQNVKQSVAGVFCTTNLSASLGKAVFTGEVYLKLGLVILNEFVDGEEIDGIEFVVH